VKVNRPDVEIRARRGYVAARAEDAAADSSPLGQMLTSVMPDPELPMAVASAPFASGKPGLAAIALAVALDMPAGDGRTANDIELAIAVFDDNAKQVTASRQTATLTPRATIDGRFRFQVLTRVELKPGNYGIRASARSVTSGTQGSVFGDVSVPDFDRAPISLSGLVVEHSGPLSSVPRDAFSGLVAAVPTTRRDFATTDRVVVHARVYQGGSTPAPVTVRTTVRDAAQALVADDTSTLTADRFQASRSADLTFALPVARLQPGEHLLTLQVSAGRRTEQRLVRFSVK
jgi:hypothetical protein